MEFIEDWGVEHVFDEDFAGTFWIQEEEELPYSCQNIEGLELFLQALKLGIVIDLVKYVILEIPFQKVPFAKKMI